jgi:hypothetical protein
VNKIIVGILYTKVENFMIIASAKSRSRGARMAIRDFSTVVYVLFYSLLDYFVGCDGSELSFLNGCYENRLR